MTLETPAGKCLIEAEDCRVKAARANDNVIRRKWLALAKEWEKLAAKADSVQQDDAQVAL
jgi:hypothetical protein